MSCFCSHNSVRKGQDLDCFEKFNPVSPSFLTVEQQLERDPPFFSSFPVYFLICIFIIEKEDKRA